MIIRNQKPLLALIPAMLALAAPAFAQTAQPHLNGVQKHPTMVGVGAAVATHHALKVAAANAKRHHKHLNFAERHPTLSALGAGVAVHHENQGAYPALILWD